MARVAVGYFISKKHHMLDIAMSDVTFRPIRCKGVAHGLFTQVPGAYAYHPIHDQNEVTSKEG
jgi:hypothetical protein